MVLGCLLSSCRTYPKPAVLFEDVYRWARDVEVQPVEQDNQGVKRSDFVARNMDMRDFLGWVSTEFQVSIVVSEKLDSMSVSMDIRDQSAETVLGVLGRRFGVEVKRVGTMFFVGELRPEDRGLLVRRVKRISGDEIKAFVTTLLSNFGRVEATSDGLCVIGDRVDVLERIGVMLDELDAASTGVWIVQLYLVRVARHGELGVKVGPTTLPWLDVSWGLARGQAEAIYDWKAGFAGRLEGWVDSGYAKIVSQPMLCCRDGSQARFSTGRVVPVPERSVSSEGTVTTTGYNNILVGTEYIVDVREIGAGSVSLGLDIRQGQITSFVDEVPVREEMKLSLSGVCREGDVYLLGSYESKQSAGRFGLPQVGLDRMSDSVLVWARVGRIDHGVASASRSGERDGATPEEE